MDSFLLSAKNVRERVASRSRERWDRLTRTPSPVKDPINPPKIFPSTGFQELPADVKIEEEKLPWYDPKDYYPAKIGEVLNGRYQIVGKLGYGATSTIWMCRGLRTQKYYAAKIFRKSTTHWGNRELSVFKTIDSLSGTTHHPGRKDVIKFETVFHISRSDSTDHMCLLYEPLSMNLHDLLESYKDRRFPESTIKTAITHVLLALDFLHEEVNITHTDLQPSNVLLGIKDASVLADYEQAEMDNPTPRKTMDDRTIYQTRRPKLSNGPPSICDFGEAQFGAGPFRQLAQPVQYRAPEVLLGMPWDHKVDIWNVGLLCWHLFQGQKLLCEAKGAETNEASHLAEMVAVLGTPPQDFLQGGGRVGEYFDATGTWTSSEEIPSKSLEDAETRLEGERQEKFLAFIRKMVQWDPKARPSAADLAYDEWLRS